MLTQHNHTHRHTHTQPHIQKKTQGCCFWGLNSFCIFASLAVFAPPGLQLLYHNCPNHYKEWSVYSFPANLQKPQEIPSERELSRNSPNAQNAVHLGIPKDFDMFCFQAETQASSTKALLIKLQNGAETKQLYIWKLCLAVWGVGL